MSDGILIVLLPRRALVRSLVLALLASVLALVVEAGPAAAAVPSTLTAPATLSGGQTLASPNGNFRLAMQADGNLVLYTRFDVVRWKTNTGGNSGAYLAVQSDGNLVVYSASGRPLWTPLIGGRGGERLMLQDDGNLVLYTASSRPVWWTGTGVAAGTALNPSAAGTLFRGAGLTNGQALVAPNGARAVLQGDGNLVVLTASGAVTWTTNSGGWTGDRLILQSDGNLVLYTAGGHPLWSTRTGGRGVVEAIIRTDGNLVLYTPTGGIVWQSAGTPRPQIFPPDTSAPPISTSRYIRDLDGTENDRTVMTTRGCADAKANPAGHRYLITLPMGAQRSDIGGGWGVMLSTTRRTISNAALVNAVKGYIDGYADCMVSYSRLVLSVATNNDSHQYGIRAGTTCPIPPSGTPDPLGASGGSIWADRVIDPLAAYAATKAQITVAGGNDIEPGFYGCQSQARSWTLAFLNASRQPYVFIGSADGCPSTGTATCNHGWTQRQLYDLAWGYGGSRMVPMPQIYNSTMAKQWAAISRVGVAAGRSAIGFGGPLTEVTACRQAGGCTSLGGVAAWNALWSAIGASASTRIAGMPYSTDLRIN